MSDRVSRTFVLCEDDPQERLVRRYMEKCGLRTAPPWVEFINASRRVHGGNVTWVLQEFPRQLQACRRRHQVRAKTLLIVVVDADRFTVAERKSQFRADPPLDDADPVIFLIPRRHIETWIRAAIGNVVNETDSYKEPDLKKGDFRAAAAAIHGWARDNPKPNDGCPPSLLSALPSWRRIGESG